MASAATPASATPTSAFSLEEDEFVAAIDDDFGPLYDKITTLEAERNSLLRSLDEAAAKLARTEHELDSVSARASSLEDDLGLAMEDLTNANLAASDSEEQIASLNGTIRALEAAKSAIEVKVAALESRVKFLEQEISFSETARGAAEEKLKAAEGQIKAAEVEKERGLEGRSEQAKADAEQLKAAQEELKYAKEKKESAEELLKALEVEFKAAKEKLTEDLKVAAEKQIELLEKLNDLEARNSKLEAEASGMAELPSMKDKDLNVNGEDGVVVPPSGFACNSQVLLMVAGIGALAGAAIVGVVLRLTKQR